MALQLKQLPTPELVCSINSWLCACASPLIRGCLLWQYRDWCDLHVIYYFAQLLGLSEVDCNQCFTACRPCSVPWPPKHCPFTNWTVVTLVLPFSVHPAYPPALIPLRFDWQEPARAFSEPDITVTCCLSCFHCAWSSVTYSRFMLG